MHQTEYLKYKSQYLDSKIQQTDQLIGGASKKIYYIRDNGGRPFQCIIEGQNAISIYGQIGYDEKKIK